MFVGGCGKSRVIAALQHFAACWGRWRAPAPTGVLLGGSTLHSLLGSQRAKSAVNVDEDDGEQVHDRSSQGRARGAVDVDGAAVDAGRDRQVLARCSRTSLALVAAIVAQGKVLPHCVRLPSVPFAVARVCILSAMTTAQHVDDLMLTTQRAMERIR